MPFNYFNKLKTYILPAIVVHLKNVRLALPIDFAKLEESRMLNEDLFAEGKSKIFGRLIYSITSIADKRKTVLREKPIAFQLFKSFEKFFCHLCLQKILRNHETINHKLFGAQDENSSAQEIGCKKCSTFYCTSFCQEKDAEFHQKSCTLRSHVSGIAGASGVNYDLLMLVTKICYLEIPSLKAINSLISHKSSVSEDFREKMFVALSDLLDIFPENEVQFTAKKLFSLSCRITANSHAVFDPTRFTNQPIGLGMFPLTAILNHSCSPNAVFFTNSNGEMQVDTIRPLEQGEQIFVSYVDLFAPKYERRGRLLETKHFWCECIRCLDEISDCWIDAFKCIQCFNGYKIERNHSYECSECGATSTSEEIFRTVSSIQDEAEDIINAGMLEFGKSLLEKALLKANEFLHPHHYIVLNISVNLVNVCSKLNHFKDCLQYCDLAIDKYRLIMDDAKLMHSSELDYMMEKKEEIKSIIEEAIKAGLLDETKSRIA